MPSVELPDRIVIDPQVCFGKPVVRGTRIWARLVLDVLADGMTYDQILGDPPQLTDEDINACVEYGALLAGGRFIELG